MCDPLSILGLVGSIGGSLINYEQQSSAMAAQEAANARWVAYQQQQAREATARDDANRALATQAQQNTDAQITAEAQKNQQSTEQQRVQTDITPDAIKPGQTTEQLAGDMLLSGQKNAAPQVQGAINTRVAQAAADARQRIAALATIQSYGGSQFSAANTVNRAFQTGNQQIDLYNNYRRGDLAAYNVAKQVEPAKIQMTPSPWGGIASSLAGIAGKGFGASMGGGANFGFSGSQF
jgi:hypothetical protein